LSVIVTFFKIGCELSHIAIPPPLLPALLLQMVEDNITGEEFVQLIPPPKRIELLLMILTFSILGSESLQQIPAP